ncbi:beta-lactamase family protein [Sphingomonas sp. NSE70-1]|uniref:Beta-lactamase family protein n=1 Tax=Sphingomonas caseinilyticus TaxID=2908205 RepID=A0ABT0RVZ5_9SPHN|nr:serine hydrolase [Sphingomonas caseinilyticus]MCL6699157.1 beta-lactamase family protein [Sphingomonas caseinilyticus]
MNRWIASSLSLLAMTAVASCATVPSSQPSLPAQSAVAFDRTSERGAWSQGLADPATGRMVTPDDPVRIASISKLVVAIGVMKLVEQGSVDLDEDVSRYLDWPVRNPAFLDRPITLRMLLSHTSSLRDGDDAYVVPLGASVKEALGDPAVWDSGHGPGEGYFAYSNFNFPLVGSIIEKVTRERFDIWMRREVLEPMKIDSCFNWPTCSDDAIARAVVLMQGGKAVRDDLHGKRPDCPVFVRDGEACDLARWRLGENGALFSPQGGLRVSARGLARVGRMLLNGGTLDGVQILSPHSVETMLAPAWRFDGRNGSRGGESYGVCSYGLAVRQLASGAPGCADDPEGKGHQWAGHAGDAYGLRSGLWIDRKRGVGIAYFDTGLPAELPPGKSSFSAPEEQAFRRAADLIDR